MNEKFIVDSPWFLDINEVIEKSVSSPNGLTEEEAKKRLKTYGTNEFRKKESTSAFDLTIKQLMSPLIFILIGASVLTAILSEWVNTFVIIGAVIVNVALGVYREYKAEETLEKLVTYIKDRSRAVRGGVEQEIDSALLVPGDIIKLSYGSRVPADSRIITLNDLKVDEAILTGESVPEDKTIEALKESTIMADRTNMVYAGTLVVQGFATAIVVNTGESTEVGKIAEIVSSTDRTVTPIQKGVNQLSWYIFIITMFACM